MIYLQGIVLFLVSNRHVCGKFITYYIINFVEGLFSHCGYISLHEYVITILVKIKIEFINIFMIIVELFIRGITLLLNQMVNDI